MKNTFVFHRRLFKEIARIKSHDSFHRYLMDEGIKRYQMSGSNECRELGSVLAVCANYREAENLRRFPFSSIVLSGIQPLAEHDRRLESVISEDPRISYCQENSESLSFGSRSFDLVFCKEGLHHLARPVQGLYEMLRICRRAAVFIESYDNLGTRMLEAMGLTTFYERGSRTDPNIFRDNFVFRWNKRLLQLLLNSYYIDSGYRVDVTLGWMSGRLLHDRPLAVKVAASAAGAVAGLLPGLGGNFATVMITPGADLPPDPICLADNHGRLVSAT